MKIEVLGDGCRRCNQLYQNVIQAVRESGKDIEIIKSLDIREITEYGVLSMPALVINGVVKVSGRVPKAKKIKEWIKSESSMQNDQ
jgi:small redox-active disulfide protein 2